MTWLEVEERLADGACVMLPTGSTEQHGPMGLIGTDTICATAVAEKAAAACGGIVAPPLAYTPAPFNTAFPGTVSISVELFTCLLREVCDGLLSQGFRGVFIVNGHGANVGPARRVANEFPLNSIVVRSWWDPDRVAKIRSELFGSWEGMHATPSEVSITQALSSPKPVGIAKDPPEPLTQDYITAHSGDRHGPPDEHRAQFPDGRVGSHSALATPELGKRLLDVASSDLAADFRRFSEDRRSSRPNL